MADNVISPQNQVARAAGTVMAAFVLSNLTGLIRQVLVAWAFGTSAEMEAFNAANRVAETIFNLVAGGALASAFIPTFTGLLTKNKSQEAWRLASAVCNLLLIILSSLALFAAIFAPQIVRHILAPGFSIDPAKETLTINLMIIMLPSAVIFGLSGLVMGTLNSHRVFFIPALTPSMYQIGMIFGVLVLAPHWGIYGLAWGVVIGAALHFLLQAPALLRLGGRYFPTLGIGIQEVGEVIRLMGPRLLGVAVVQLNFWVNTRLASQQPEGSVTGVVLAFTLMLMPQAAIAQSIAIAALPSMSAQVTRGRLDEMRSTLAASLRGMLLLSIPASLGLILLREPLVRFLYQRGEFTSHSTDLVTWALLWYAAGLVGHCVVEIMARAFYAMRDTKTPVMIGVLAMSLNVVFSYLFSALFESINWAPHGGLALANSLATALEMVGLVYVMRRRLSGLEGKTVLAGGLQAGFAAAVMSLILWVGLQLLVFWPAWLVAGTGILVGCVVYSSGLFLLKVSEINILLMFIRRKMLRLL